MATQAELRASTEDRLEMALEDLNAALDGGREFPDAAYAVAHRWAVPQERLEALYDEIGTPAAVVRSRAAARAAPIDPDEALWDKARSMLAQELGVGPGEVSAADRHYIEMHAPAYAADLLREDDELEGLYDEAHRRLVLAFSDALPPRQDPNHYLIALAAPVVVHAVLQDRAGGAS
jgi:hypothetical protein